VIEADARSYLSRLRQRFDLIVEDVFVGRGRAVRKPEWLAGPALGRLAQRLAPGGLLVSNALDEAPATASEFARLFPHLCLSSAISTTGCWSGPRACRGAGCADRWRASRCSRGRCRVCACARSREAIAPLAQELEHGAVEALRRLGHHQVRAVGDRDQMRSRDLVGELAMELGRRERVLAAADHQRSLADQTEPVGGVVLGRPRTGARTRPR
jgi:hypothetical protein